MKHKPIRIKQSAWYVISAKQEETFKIFHLLIYDSENGIHIKPLRQADANPNRKFSFKHLFQAALLSFIQND